MRLSWQCARTLTERKKEQENDPAYAQTWLESIRHFTARAPDQKKHFDTCLGALR